MINPPYPQHMRWPMWEQCAAASSLTIRRHSTQRSTFRKTMSRTMVPSRWYAFLRLKQTLFGRVSISLFPRRLPTPLSTPYLFSASTCLEYHFPNNPSSRNAISRKPSAGNHRFQHSQIPAFPRSFFVDNLRKAITLAGLDASHYAGHSFRRGLATWAKLSARMQDTDIKLLGRWSSDAVKLYQETPTSHLAELARSTLRLDGSSRHDIIPTTDCWWGDE